HALNIELPRRFPTFAAVLFIAFGDFFFLFHSFFPLWVEVTSIKTGDPEPEACYPPTTELDVGAMRYEKPALLLELARMLASSAEGMTLDEMAQRSGESRRTIE